MKNTNSAKKKLDKSRNRYGPNNRIEKSTG